MTCRRPLVPFLFLAASTGAAAQDPAPPVAGTHVLEEITVPLREGEISADRGVLFVPIVRANPESATIEIEFHRFRTSPENADRPPIFLLNGGPSFAGLGRPLARKGFYEDNIQPLASLADVVVVGQRGIGSSKPNTVCDRPAPRRLDQPFDEEEEFAVIAEASARCRAHWESEGLDLSGLNVIEAATDVVEVANALGYDKIVLSGGSFGSHWAMAIMRYHPERVARALLSSIEGPDHTYDMPTFVLNSLKRIAAAAEAAPELAEHIPEGGLIGAFERVVARVREEPIVVTLGKAEVLFDARAVQDMALGYTRRTSSRAGMRTWPADVLRLVNGDFKLAAQVAGRNNAFRQFPTASFFMLDCGSGISAERLSRLLTDPAAEVVGPLGRFYQAACPVWRSDLGDGFRLGFETEIPTVLVHGTWDTSTPFENAVELTAVGFRDCKLVVVEGGSHGALGEALRESEGFADGVMKFLSTGDMRDVPGLVELPALEWVVPGG